MSATETIDFSFSLRAAANVVRRRFVGYDGNYCAANAKAVGVIAADTDSGEMAPISAPGSIALVETGGAVTAGLEVASDSTGRAVNGTAISATVPGSGTTVTSSSAQPAMTMAGGILPQKINGMALEASAGAGEFIRVLLR